MKKKLLVFLLFIVFLIVLFLGLEVVKYLCLRDQNINYSMLNFVDSEWEDGSEIIYFSSNGHFSYYDNSGSPVDNYDLCESFVYDTISKKIKLICLPFVFKGEDLLRIVSVDENILKLNFNGEIKQFRKVVDYSSFEYDFIDLGWTRKIDGIKETLNIWDDGRLEYSYEIEEVAPKYINKDGSINEKICDGVQAYGSVYDDETDTYTVTCSVKPYLGEYYTYNDEEKVITIFSKENPNDKTNVKIIFSDEDTLKLDFDGDIRKFKKY